ncbi:MAG: hypothetical protein IKN70_02445 [Fibrobacter sp.]|uniref:hypothetical protein n=1 Tax=Fibrobacter sp. TaxID=35828 RepID=UPI001B0FD187|nr:hypothetical protein [Fibrobacter sp.]MBO7061950.1 hypothetical protein [Fibrobacter sp.]MBR3668859.1 hypothetical protein [Fibrobacter sp.]
MNLRTLLLVPFFCVSAMASTATDVADSSSVQPTDGVADTTSVQPATDVVDSSSVKPTTDVADTSSTKAASVAADSSSAKSDSSSRKGGLLEALYPIEPDEAVAKGRVLGGASLSLIQAETDDDALDVIIGEIYKAEGYSFTVEAFAGYFIKDALAVGLRAGYSRTWYDIDFSLMEDLMDLSQHRKYVSNGFFFQPFLKNYLKVFDSRTLYFFNETSLMVEYSYGLSQADDGEDISKTRNNKWTIEFGLNPGLCIMMLDRVAFETSVGLLGLSSSIVEVDENGEKSSKLVYNVVNFTINLLALEFSLVYFF